MRMLRFACAKTTPRSATASNLSLGTVFAQERPL